MTGTPRGWWSTTAEELTGLSVCDARISTGPTRLTRRRSFTRRHTAVALVINRDDHASLTGTPGGRWMLAQQAAIVDVDKPVFASIMPKLRIIAAVTAVAAVALAITGTGPWPLAAATVAVLSSCAAAWLWREERRDRTSDVLAADRTATVVYGSEAAVEALTARPALYRSAVHAAIDARNPISTTNRLDRLTQASA